MIKTIYSLVEKFNRSNGLDKCIISFCTFIFLMLAFRLLYTGKPMFLFLAWNLFLGYLPLLISTKMIKGENDISTSQFLIMFTGWLLLLPNSFYIVTDLFHLKERAPIPLWYDLSLIFSASWMGLVFGIVSLRHMEVLVKARWKPVSPAFFIVPVMFLISVGIYIGRYLRYNSWDVVTDPLALVGDMIYLCVHPIRNRFDWSMIVCFTILFSLFYFTMKELTAKRVEMKKEMV
jgi:uncharacterized membrane protein